LRASHFYRRLRRRQVGRRGLGSESEAVDLIVLRHTGRSVAFHSGGSRHKRRVGHDLGARHPALRPAPDQV